MDSFITWKMLLTMSGLVSAVYMVTQFTKELPIIKTIQTKYWSYIIAVVLILASNIAVGAFTIKDIILYLLNAIPISLSANGLHNFSTPQSVINIESKDSVNITKEEE